MTIVSLDSAAPALPSRSRLLAAPQRLGLRPRAHPRRADLSTLAEPALRDIGLSREELARRGPTAHWDLPPGSYFHR
jgi:uncharacterized protein YjiS (DUF1127 family)